MSFLNKLFSLNKMTNEELLEKLLKTGRIMKFPTIILEKVNPFFKEKANELGSKELQPWLEGWYYSPDLLEFVYTHFTLGDLTEISKHSNLQYELYATDTISETLIDQEKHPIEVDDFDDELKTAFYVTALMIRDIVANSLP